VDYKNVFCVVSVAIRCKLAAVERARHQCGL
jgi:hypothetical protein